MSKLEHHYHLTTRSSAPRRPLQKLLIAAGFILHSSPVLISSGYSSSRHVRKFGTFHPYTSSQCIPLCY
ncbi:hypothetical protein L2E82_35190 [Cichorium intybus]|uniref:Uncharacterized protein n=1 Tax=Cichorium intybus TaxID=13427 RepID=A0ACB9BNG0_CICIN|nr:hypothetical protein L2E82_35190 [Cichorium intybus]